MTHELELRVRYRECDPMGVVHHTVYPTWFEMGRTELLRSMGGCYRDLEAAGIFLVVVKLEVQYRQPARYDEVLTLETSLVRSTRAKIEHAYSLQRDGVLLATGETTLACLDATGHVREVPGSLVTTGDAPAT